MSFNDSSEIILYVKSINSEWNLEKESNVQSFEERCESLAPPQGKGSAWTYLSSLTLNRYELDCYNPDISKLIDSQSSWKMLLSNSKEKLAILQDYHIEIRISKDDFSSVNDKWILPSRDLFPQWRNLAWSPCDSLIAISESSGNVFLFSSTGEKLSHIFQPKNPTYDLGNAACALIFKERRSSAKIDDNQHWNHELLVITYRGIMTTFVISLEGDHRILHTFDFEAGYPNGILDAVFVSSYSLLFVGGGTCLMPQVQEFGCGDMLKHGISVWRVLSGYPYYKNISDLESSTTKIKTTFPSKKWWWPWSLSEEGDRVLKMTPSPDSKTLVTVHSSECLCIWNLPSLRLFKRFSIRDQPDRDYNDPELSKNQKKKKLNKESLNAFNIVSLGWWSNQDLIISRGTGSLVVCSIENLKNRLGSLPELFEPEHTFTRFSDGCFYVLECVKMEDCHKDDKLLNDSGDADVNPIHTKSLGNMITPKVWNILKYGIYYITSFKAFHPPNHLYQNMRRNYRMICLKSTTPEELYSNMLDAEEYGEALLLAKKYNLDCDLTYQRQWKKFPVSVSSIQDYLGKVTKRSWVLHECLETVPDDLNAMEELIKYGLRGTNLEAVIIAGHEDDEGKFFCESLDDFISMSYEEGKSKITEDERKQELLKRIDFDNLTLKQKELCRIRLKLLHYLDKFETYQEILGGKDLASKKYDKDFFKRFRKDNIFHSAIKFAQNSDIAALQSLFKHHGDKLLPHRLPILSSIPESTMPCLFQHLLPKIGCKFGEMKVTSWRESLDWSEQFCSFLNVMHPEESDEQIYKENPELLEFRKGEILTEENISMWYKKRSLEVEERSGQVDCAYELLSLGIKNNIQGLDFLHDEFALMEVLIYECHVDPSFSFSSLQKMTRVERMCFMMSKTSQEMYIRNIKRWVVPYLKQEESKTSGSYYSLLLQYLLKLSSEDLTFVELIFLDIKQGRSGAIIEDMSKMLSIATECLYAHSRCDQFSKIKTIIECLPDLYDSTEEANIIGTLSCHLLGAETLKRNKIEYSLAQIRDIQNSEIGSVQVLERLARIAANRNPEMSPKELELLLFDMCLLQEKVFTMITKNKIYEIFIGSLLSSGNLNHINLGGAIMDSHFKLFSANHDLTNKPISTKLSIRSSIKDSIKSLTSSSASSSFPIFNCSLAGEITNFSIDQTKFTELALQAAMEYFNSSPDCLHENMKLARSCLELIKYKAPQILEELNLIEALVMLKYHGISEFPAQLRMSGDRLEYIRLVLKKKNMMYKNYSKLLELGKLFNIGQGDEQYLQGQVFDLIAQHALEANDMTVCLDSCKKIMSLNYGEGWKICKSLAESENFCDDISKSELFDFILLHVPDCYLSGIIEEFEDHLINTLCLKVANTMASHDQRKQSSRKLVNTRGVQSFENALIDKTRRVFSLSKTAVECIGDSQWWLGAAMELKRFTIPEAKKTFRSEQTVKEVAHFTKQTFHPFYNIVENLLPVIINEKLVDMDIYTSNEIHNTMLDVNELLLRIHIVGGFHNVNDDKLCEDITRVLVLLAENEFLKDTSLGLFYLLSLPKGYSAEECFALLPKTVLCYQIATYFFALKIASQAKTFRQSASDFLTFHPKLLVHKIKFSNQKDDFPIDEMKLFDYYMDLLINYQESEILINMDRGIDTARFSSDESYKKETILGMALTLDDKVLSSATKLASKYNIPSQDLYMAHLGYLFDDSCGLTTKQIQKRITELNMMKVLNECPMQFHQMMQEQIFPLIDGSDLDRLILFYKCLIPSFFCDNDKTDGTKPCTFKNEVFDGDKIMPEIHIKMLEQFKITTQGLNYKDLIFGRCDAENIIKPILDESNIEVFSNIFKYIRDKDGKIVNPSCVYKCYASKILNSSVIGSEDNLVLKYKTCHEYVQKMEPDTLIDFVHENLFGINIIKKVPIENRKQILKVILKHTNHQISLSREINLQEKTKWKEAAATFQKLLDHLNKMSSKTISKLTLSSDENKQQYADDFDLTQSEPSKIKELIKKMISAGESIEFVDDIIRDFSFKEFICGNLYMEVLDDLCSSLNESEAEHNMTILKVIFSEILKHSSAGGSIINANDACKRLKNCITKCDFSPCITLQLMDLIKNSHEEKIEDIIYSQTCAILSLLGYHKDQLTVEKLSDEHERVLIFNELLDNITLSQLPNILCLLDIWIDHLQKSSENLWKKLLIKLVIKFPDDGATFNHVMQLAGEFVAKSYLNLKDIEHLSDLMAIKDPLAACKVLFTSPDDRLTLKAISILQSMDQDTEDQELFVHLLRHCKLHACTSLPFYHKLTRFIVTSGSRLTLTSLKFDKEIEHIIPSALKELASANQIEAGTLYMSLKATKRALRTFDASINFSNKCLFM